MMRLALAEWVKFVDISQLSVALHCNSLPRFIDTLIFIYFYKFFFTVKSQAVEYSILDSLGRRSQYISIKFPLHKQSENP